MRYTRGPAENQLGGFAHKRCVARCVGDCGRAKMAGRSTLVVGQQAFLQGDFTRPCVFIILDLFHTY